MKWLNFVSCNFLNHSYDFRLHFTQFNYHYLSPTSMTLLLNFYQMFTKVISWCNASKLTYCCLSIFILFKLILSSVQCSSCPPTHAQWQFLYKLKTFLQKQTQTNFKQSLSAAIINHIVLNFTKRVKQMNCSNHLLTELVVSLSTMLRCLHSEEFSSKHPGIWINCS